MSTEKELAAVHAARITECKSCNAKIIYLETAAGKKMPVDAATVYQADIMFDRAKHMTHFATCITADKHRKTK